IGDLHPGMFEVDSGSVSVAGELYRMPDSVWQRVEADEPPHLYRGPVRLVDGRSVDGILFPGRSPRAGTRTFPNLAIGAPASRACGAVSRGTIALGFLLAPVKNGNERSAGFTRRLL